MHKRRKNFVHLDFALLLHFCGYLSCLFRCRGWFFGALLFGLPVTAVISQTDNPAPLKIFVRQFEFEGNRRYTAEDLSKVLESFSGREVTGEELELARAKVAQFYLESGFASSEVALPDQDPSGGVIRFRIVEDKTAALPPEEMPVLPDEMTLLPGELEFEAVREPAIGELPSYRLRLAQEAMQPVLPPLQSWLSNIPALPTVSVFVKRFEFRGNTAFSDGELGKLLKSYTGREVTSEELENARTKITELYVEAGYISSGAVLPEQDFTDGVIRFEVVEGTMSEVRVRGTKWFRPEYFETRLRGMAGTPVDVNQLKTGLQILRQNPTVTRINAELEPGIRPGETILDMAIKDEHPFRAGIVFSNARPPSVGEGIGDLYFSDLNLTGFNDPLHLHWGIMEWDTDGRFNYAGFNNLGGSYEYPFTPWDTRIGVHASKSNTNIIDETFAELGINSESYEYGFYLTQPIYETLRNSLLVSLAADREHSRTFLLGEPFSLSAGARDGESDVFALRFGVEWTNRSQVHVLTLRSTFNVGLHAFGSTEADPQAAATVVGGPVGIEEIPDSQFFSWLGQGQLVWRPFEPETDAEKEKRWWMNAFHGTSVILRGNVQISNDPLMSLEQFSIGGIESVRGYRENQLLRDNGLFASAEVNFPIWMTKDLTPIVSLVGFFDYGAGWNVTNRNEDFQEIYSAGTGVLLNAAEYVQGRLYWGHPFVELNEENDSLQDYGIFFELSFNAF